MELEKYLKHLPTCNKSKDWFEAQEALSLCTDGSETDLAWQELKNSMNTCTCGMEDALLKLNERRFTATDVYNSWKDGYHHGNI